MRIVVSGGTGFIGEPLCRALQGDHEVAVLTRHPSSVRAGRPVQWNPPDDGPWQEIVASSDAVINLAGESIAGGRWTDSRKKALRSSRIESTEAIVSALRRQPDQPHRLISASAVGYYGDRGDEVLDESTQPGEDFLSCLGIEWEAAAVSAEDVADVTIVRLGVVIGAGGGALGAMRPVFRLGLGGRLGSGEQWMAWIARTDVIRLIQWILEDGGRTGVYNASAPEPVRNRDFTRELGRALHRPTIVPVPAFALRLALGEMADASLLVSQRVIPRRALDEGFEFAHPEIRSAFETALA